MCYHERPVQGSWHLNRKMLDGAIDFLESEFKVDCTHDVPYVAGYSKDGKTLFIDWAVPKKYYRYLLLHEGLEKILIDRGLDYLHAHQIALREEKAAVIADGLSWQDYNSDTMALVKRIGSRKTYPNCPRTLDLRPYKEEKDSETLDRMEYSDVT